MKKESKQNVDVKKSKVSVYSQDCKSDFYKDADVVVEHLAVNIDDMLQTGVVKDSSETLDNNGIDNPDAIVGRIKDGFDALDAARIIKKYGRKPAKAQAAVNEVVENASNEPR